MTKYIWQNPAYPKFSWNDKKIFALLAEIKFAQGQLLGKMQCLGFEHSRSEMLSTLTEEVVHSSEIEGLRLNAAQVHSSVARRLGIAEESEIPAERSIQGAVDMTLDAVRNTEKLTEERLCFWHTLLFPEGTNGLYSIKTGAYRDDTKGAMQIVSGSIGHEKVHYEALPAAQLKTEMDKLLLWINKDKDTDDVIKAAVAHLWFVINHPFEDGNGRIARAISEMLLARSEGTDKRYYSLSSQINSVRKEYYKALEITGQTSLDITDWIVWFLEKIKAALEHSDRQTNAATAKAAFWEQHKQAALNKRQQKVATMLLDGFDGALTSSKYAKICRCSQDTAQRDLAALEHSGIVTRSGEGRTTHYELSLKR